jgi:hypothetical protein
MELGVKIEQLSREQLLELVKLLIAENEKLRAEIALLKAELEQLKRQNKAPLRRFPKTSRRKIPNVLGGNREKASSAIARYPRKKTTASRRSRFR